MKKVQYSIYRQETGSAGGKAKNDCSDILKTCGYALSYRPSDNRKIRIAQQVISMLGFRKEELLVVQYPAVSRQLMPLLQKRMKKVKITVAVVHDIPALQGMGGEVRRQIEELNCFKYLIVHNGQMKKKLMDAGCTAKMICLNAFDYLHDYSHPLAGHEFDGTICVAGNLDKSSYLLDVGQMKDIRFNLYGVNNKLDFSHLGNAAYNGLLSSDEIPYLIEADYGLVWDGESIDTCSGVYGEYLKYNNPHKMSMYLAAGKPVITWNKAAIADFIKRNDIGIAVGSLRELKNIDLSSNYARMKNNVMKIKKYVSEGHYLSRAIREVEKDITILYG